MTFFEEGRQRANQNLFSPQVASIYAAGYDDGAANSAMTVIDIIRKAEQKLPNERAVTREQLLLIIDSLMQWVKEKRPQLDEKKNNSTR